MTLVFRILLTLVSVSVLAACATSGGNSTAAEEELPSLEIVSPPQFLALLEDLDTRLDEGDPRQLNEVEQRRFDRISRSLRMKLSGLDDINQLDEDEQLEVFNSTEELVATVVGRPEDQIICRRVHRVGTNFQETTCKTVAEMREDQDRSRLRLREIIDTQPLRLPKPGESGIPSG